MQSVEAIRKQVVGAFEKLNPSTKQALASIDSPMQLGFAVLALAEENTPYKELSAATIAAALVAAGVASTTTQIQKAFARAGGRVVGQKLGDETYYKLMTAGRNEVDALIHPGPLEVVYIEAGKPRKARSFLGELLGGLTGTVRISDPWYGVRSLEALALIPPTCLVEFLTARTNESQTKLAGPIADFKVEHPKFQLRKLPNPNQLHDRYVLSDDKLLILGHGIKDIGNKESFVITVDKSLAPDLHASIGQTFDIRWNLAQSL